MIKQGVRKALRLNGTVLIAERSIMDYDDSGNLHETLVGGDLVMLTGKRSNNHIEGVVVATGRQIWFRRDWLVHFTSLAFDARCLDETG